MENKNIEISKDLVSYALQQCLLHWFSIHFSFTAQPFYFEFLLELQTLDYKPFKKTDVLAFLQNWFTTNKSKVQLIKFFSQLISKNSHSKQ